MFRVTSIGEILFDVYPGSKKLGGAPFNLIYHVIKLTGRGNFVSRIGRDELGDEIISFLKEKNISTEYIQIDDKHSTGIARPKLDKEKVPEWKIETNTAYDFIELNTSLKNLISKQTDCLCFGTLAQRSPQSGKTIQALFNYDIKYFCDLNIRQNFYSEQVIMKSLETANVLKLNEDELKLVSNLLLRKNTDFKTAANELLRTFNIDLLCVTRGEDGAVLFNGKHSNDYSRKVTDVVDTVGAGDAYAAILCIGYLKGWDIEKINITASEFAAEIVKVEGALPDDDELYAKFGDKI